MFLDERIEKSPDQGLKRRETKCHEETEQAQEVKELEQVEASGEAVADADKAAVLAQDPAGTAFARAVVNEFTTSSQPLVLSKNAPKCGATMTRE